MACNHNAVSVPLVVQGISLNRLLMKPFRGFDRGVNVRFGFERRMP